MSPVFTDTTSTAALTLSTRLVSELGDPHSKLRATTGRVGEAVLVNAGGEVDACNEHTWHQLVREAAVGVTAPGPLVIDVTGLEFMGCCAFMALADEAVRCRSRGVELRLVSGEPLVGRVVKACGLGGVLPLYPTADAALATTAHW